MTPGAAPVVTVGAEPQQPRGFLEWCRDAAAPDEVRYTVTVLIAYLETDDRETAARSLATEDRLDLENYAVTREFGLDEYRPPPPTFAQMFAERPVRDLRESYVSLHREYTYGRLMSRRGSLLVSQRAEGPRPRVDPRADRVRCPDRSPSGDSARTSPTYRST